MVRVLGPQRIFVLFAAGPAAVVAAISIMGAGAPSSSIESIADPVLVVHDGAHPIDYYVAPGPNGSELVHTKYQSIGAWSRIASGSAVIPSSITQPGDLAFVNADKTSANGRRTVTISANSDQPQRFLSCLVPLRLWLSTDHGGHWTDSTALMTDGQSGPSARPFFFDCTRGAVTFTVPTTGSKDAGSQQYEVSIEPGGVISAVSVEAGVLVSADAIDG